MRSEHLEHGAVSLGEVADIWPTEQEEGAMPVWSGAETNVDHVLDSARPVVLPVDGQLVILLPTDHVGHPDRRHVTRPVAVVADRAGPHGPVQCVVVWVVVGLVVAGEARRGAEALRVNVDLLEQEGIARHEVLQAGEDFDGDPLVEFEAADIGEETQDRLEIDSAQLHGAGESTPNGE